MTQIPFDVSDRLKRHHQEHLLLGWADLSPVEQSGLIDQLASIDFEELEQLYRKKDEPHAVLPTPDRITPLPVEPRSNLTIETALLGEQAIRRGEVAVLLVAGGQGSRLGSDKPKGVFPVGPVTGASLFQIHAEQVLALRRQCDARIPFLVMTSSATHAETQSFFEAHNYFGLPQADVRFFQQGSMPALDIATGQLLLERPGKLFLSPNGHGGTLTALADSGLLAELEQSGVRHVFYFQVDNPLVRIADPLFIGRHIETQSQASSKVVFKDRPEEKVGVLAAIDGRCSIIEYSDMPPDMTAQRDASGELVYRAGNPAIHLFTVDFLKTVTSGTTRLAYHIARKKVPCVGPDGQPLVPTTENALKFEMFIFDALPVAERYLAVAVERRDEFAPLKNATGTDSPETVRRAQIERAARWLEAAGVAVPRTNGESTFPIEIRPRFALDAADLVGKIPAGFVVNGPTVL